MLYFISKQAYKLKLPKWWRIYDIFYLSLLEQNITKKEWVDKKVTELEFEFGNNKRYNVGAIWNSAFYTSKLEGYLLSQYYLVAWKLYLEEENT